MSTSKTYLKYEKSQNNTLIIKEQTETLKNYNKIATLEPYLTEIEKKNKGKKQSTKNKNKLNQSSSKSFRIKDLSTSLHKLTLQKSNNNKQGNNTTATLQSNHKLKISNFGIPTKQKRAKSNDRAFQSSFSKTISTQKRHSNFNGVSQKKQEKATINVLASQDQKTNFFNDYFLRIKDKDKQSNKPQNFRKNFYEPTGGKRKSNSQAGEISISKISYTDVNIDRKAQQQKRISQNQLQNAKRTEQVRKNNFRRGKYEAMHSSVNNDKTEFHKNQEESNEPLHSERLYGKKQLNHELTINEQMDILAEKEMIKFYRQVRTKEIQKSLEKSTEKYFENNSYRPIKSKNEIQLYVNSMQNPSKNAKISQSTNDKSDNRNKSPLDANKISSDLYAYNFEFQPQKLQSQNIVQNKIYEMQNPSEEQSSFNNMTEQNFEKQRRQAQIKFFLKGDPQLDWSDDNCQIDEI